MGRARVEIDNRRTGDTNRDNVTWACTLWRRRADVGARPNRQAGVGMKRVNIIRFGHRNYHWAVWTALDIKRLCINVTRDCSVEVQVARQVSRVARRERGVDIEAVPGRMMMFLGNVDLRVCWTNRGPQKNNDK